MNLKNKLLIASLGILFFTAGLLIAYMPWVSAETQVQDFTKPISISILKLGSQLVLSHGNTTQVFNATENISSAFTFNYTYTCTTNITITNDTITNVSVQNYYVNDTQAGEIKDSTITRINNLEKYFEENYFAKCKIDFEQCKDKWHACNNSLYISEANRTMLYGEINLCGERNNDLKEQRNTANIQLWIFAGFLILIILFVRGGSIQNLVRQIKGRPAGFMR